jgi:hypothetical protein
MERNKRNMTEQVDQNDDMQRLRKALEFYADPNLYKVDGPLVGGAWGSSHYPIDDDRGETARLALSESE